VIHEVCTSVRIFVAAIWTFEREASRHLRFLRKEIIRGTFGRDFGIDALRSALLTPENPFL